ncbi:TPA: glycosyltransferase family 8 protein, partial [Pasteurella multocida]|nr:glycosyltransferase family 8 protein [Pasteurella multocida]
TENKNIILQMVTASKSNITFIPVDINDFKEFPENIGYISLATYARLKAVDYLPCDINKIIYLDVDLLVFDDLTPLWETNIENYGIAACFDSFIECEIPEHKFMIDLSPENYYFNAGVMVLNLDLWRKIDVFNSSLDWLGKYGKKAKYQDQDILNGIFKNNVYYLDCRFNFMPNQLDRIKKYELGKLSS